MRGYPAFVDAGSTVDLRVFATSGQQQDALGPGIGRLLRLSVSSPVKAIERQLDPRTRLTLGANPNGSLAALLDDCADAAVAALVTAPVWARDEFIALRDRVGKSLVSTTLDVVSRVEKVLAAAHEVQLLVPAQPTRAQAEAITDVRAQLDRLLPPRFVTRTGAARLTDLVRYLTAIRRRLDQLPHAINADHQRMAQVHAVQDAYDDLIRALPPARKTAADVRRHRVANRGVTGQPVGTTTGHTTPDQRAADLSRHPSCQREPLTPVVSGVLRPSSRM